jgi:hypothetical protein
VSIPEIALRVFVALCLLGFALLGFQHASEKADMTRLPVLGESPATFDAVLAFIVLIGAWLVFSPVLR